VNEESYSELWIQCEPDEPVLWVLYGARSGQPGRRLSQHESIHAAESALSEAVSR
jgi:hypothetical protein